MPHLWRDLSIYDPGKPFSRLPDQDSGEGKAMNTVRDGRIDRKETLK
jgi:hypothetical protein